MKAIKFKEKDWYSIELPRGLYLIDKTPLNVETYNAKIQVKDIKNVIPITRSIFVDYYASGNSKLTIDEFHDKKRILLSKRHGVDEYKDEWESLDDEFAFRKFIESWKSINKSIEVHGDPYTFEIVEAQLDTGNEFINSEYINGGKNPLLFTYDLQAARLSIVENKFKELEMEYKGNVSYSFTNNKKVWGNSTHSGIRYVTAFGTYVFNDAWRATNSIKGDLDKLLTRYNKDKEALEDIIQTKYNVHFGKIDIGEFDFDELLKILKICKTNLNTVESKNKTSDDLYRGKNRLNEGIRFIENNYKELIKDKG